MNGGRAGTAEAILPSMGRFRPSRSARALFENVPKPAILTVSQLDSTPLLAENITLTALSATALEREASTALRDSTPDFSMP